MTRRLEAEDSTGLRHGVYENDWPFLLLQSLDLAKSSMLLSQSTYFWVAYMRMRAPRSRKPLEIRIWT